MDPIRNVRRVRKCSTDWGILKNITSVTLTGPFALVVRSMCRRGTFKPTRNLLMTRPSASLRKMLIKKYTTLRPSTGTAWKLTTPDDPAELLPLFQVQVSDRPPIMRQTSKLWPTPLPAADSPGNGQDSGSEKCKEAGKGSRLPQYETIDEDNDILDVARKSRTDLPFNLEIPGA